MKPRIAIIGAGISGLTLANILTSAAEVIVFEKARGVGGRMSTRYADPFYFDHGAHNFTARTKPFQSFLRPLMEGGTISEWTGKVINLEIGKKITKRMWFEPHLVASPNMNSLCKKLAEGITINLNTEVAPLEKLVNKQPAGWNLSSKENVELGIFDWVISTAPPAQTILLYHDYMPENSSLYNVKMHGCYSLMLGFNGKWDKKWIAAKVHNNPIKWISINSTKPGRNKDVTSIVAHSCQHWADAHINDDMEEAQNFLLGQFKDVSGIDCYQADYISTHRWKYAEVDDLQESENFLFDDHNKIAATSDWCSSSRIEEVWTNANQLANKILKNIE